jgi:hypothetical protein
MGCEFYLDCRLAQIVACTLVTFMFSSGMPILYLVMILNFSFTYWVDKTLLLRFYRIPINFDNTAIKFSLMMMKFAIVFHYVIGYQMMSNKDIIYSS